MKKLLLLLILPLFFSCGGDDEQDQNITPNRKYKYVIYNDPDYINKCDVYDIVIINNDAFGKLVDTDKIEEIKFGEKSDTIYTNGCNIFFTHKYKDKDGKEQYGRIKNDIFIEEDYPNIISLSGFHDDRKRN
ncbi:hypothetical protein D0T84_01125 [Dysgonomonas sp. 521]|uniref:hypothetical protein n=1 Tax=Dysgonomonas sp. 521 TaxID=2302932 RepID=UPI0013D4D7E5|nr:hypothetical protein [Dysgonomonas sp. 521]NDV93518.1 hypothetical protein [Dysgonomonas sp. 521]